MDVLKTFSGPGVFISDVHWVGGGGGGVKPLIHFHCVLHAKGGGGERGPDSTFT